MLFSEGEKETMPKEPALRATHLDWDRELCKQAWQDPVRVAHLEFG